MATAPDSCMLVIFGASGDLARRKLIPGLFNLHKRGLLPQRFAVLGVGRTSLDDDTFRARMQESLNGTDHFLHFLHYQPVDTAKMEDFHGLRQRLEQIDAESSIGGRYLFYMSTPPSLFEPIAAGLAEMGLNQESSAQRWRRLVVEKPYGYDLASAIQLNDSLHRYFTEKQMYRIDHYLGKETVQNMLVFRFANGVYEPLWNRNYIDRVEVTASEQIGVEGRGGYYEHSGALRDMFQNHLLQVVGMLAMEPPGMFRATTVRNETIKVFESLAPFTEETVDSNVVRGQYVSADIGGQPVRGYREEDDVRADSRTETYVAVRFFINNWRWAGVPFLVRTGKRLPTRLTEAVVHFKRLPHQVFGGSNTYEGNQLIIRIQPDEGIEMKFNLKVPGEGFDVDSVNMDFHYADLTDAYVPEAYERLLLDSMLGDATLYARGDAVEACWHFVEPILRRWERNPEFSLLGYPAGTWGPKESRNLIPGEETDWRYPCADIAESGQYRRL